MRREDPSYSKLLTLTFDQQGDFAQLRGVIIIYQEPDSYIQKVCDRKCSGYKLQLMLDDGEETGVVGIEMLLSDCDETISLTPVENQWMERRDER